MQQALANGLTAGLAIALLAVAFAIVYAPTRVFHLALAGVYSVVPYAAWAGAQAGLPLALNVTMAVVLGTSLSVACEACNHRRLQRKGASEGAHLITSLGISIVLSQSVALFFGSETKVLRTGADSTVPIASAQLTAAQLTTIIVAGVVIAGFICWLRATRIGLRLRALTDNPAELSLRGHNTQQLRFLAFGLSGALASVAALLTANDVGFHPTGGLPALLLAIVAMIIGGRGSFIGPILGGIVVGLIRDSVIWWWSAKWEEAATFLLLLICLLFLPYGILGRKSRLEGSQP